MDKVKSKPGQAKFRCVDHQRETTLAWAAGYPLPELPRCPHGPKGDHAMEWFEGEHPADDMVDPPAE